MLKDNRLFGRSRGSESLAFDQRHGKALARSLRQWAPAILSSYQDADEAAEVKRMLEIHVDRLDSFSKTTEGESAVLCVSGCGGGVLGWYSFSGGILGFWHMAWGILNFGIWFGVF